MKMLIIATILALAPIKALAFEYDVDMPNSGDPKFQMIRVTIEKCETKFKIKTEDFEKFSKDDKAMTQLVKKAMEHQTSGCAKN